MGRQIKEQGLVFFILMLGFCSLVPSCSAADVNFLSIRIVEGNEQYRFNHPVLVAGIWHDVNITMDSMVEEMVLRFYKGTDPPSGTRNETNYYEWIYDKNNPDTWEDLSGYDINYLQQTRCIAKDTVYVFCIGIMDMLPNVVDYYENWTLEVSHVGSLIHTERVVVEKPKTGISLAKPSSILFRVQPFTIEDAQGDNFFKIGNKGNIPLRVSFDEEKYPDVDIIDIDKKFLPNETKTHYVIVHSKSWPPGFKRTDIQITCLYDQFYFIDTNATVTLQTSFIIDVPQLIVYVGHSDYEIEEIQGTGIVFQYLEKLTMSEGEIRDITSYVSGNGEVTMEIWADEQNLSVVEIYDGSTEIRSPLSFTSTNMSERTIIVTVKALSERTMGILTYRITANGVTKTYTTQITIGPPSTPNQETGSPASIMQIVVVIIVLLVVIYMIVSYVRNKKR